MIIRLYYNLVAMFDVTMLQLLHKMGFPYSTDIKINKSNSGYSKVNEENEEGIGK